MTTENSKIFEVLERGGTVVVPSRQRAVAVRLAQSRQRLAASQRAWRSGDVLPWSAWLERCAQQARFGALRGLRRLGAAEEWLLWREAAEQACEGRGVLLPASLADALRRACALERDWGLRWPGAPTGESAVLQQARLHFGQRCRALRAFAPTDWSIVLAGVTAGEAPLLFAGFPEMGPALASRLRALNGEFWPEASAGEAATATPDRASSIVPCASAADELRQAALWCRGRLERDPSSRLLVVVPRLRELQAAATQAFEHGLQGAELLSAHAADPASAPFAIEGGTPLADYPLVQAALGALAAAGSPLPFEELAALLRTPYISCGTAAQRAALELSLRDRNVHAASFHELAGLAGSVPHAGGEALAKALAALAPQLQVAAGMRQSADGWARRFAGWLEALGWPGARALGSAEQQQCERFRELLGELALLGAARGALGHGEALELLRSLARRIAFEPATDDLPVTLTAALDDPLVHYDGIWVCGLGADTWPAPSRPDPFVPIGVQRAAGVPAASPEGRLALARRAMAAWLRCAGELVLSWPQQDGDVPLQPSSLLGQPLRRHDDDPDHLAPALPDPLLLPMQRSGRRERQPSGLPGAWPAQRTLPGGTRALELQSQCPFRALAQLRLGAVPVAEPVPGLDRRERGLLLHRALELLWGELCDSRALRRLAPEARVPPVRAAVAQALSECLAARATPLAAVLARNEAERLHSLLLALLEQELERADFEVLRREQGNPHLLGGWPIRVRMDRVDRLDDGRLVVIDYKSGADAAFRPMEARPRQAQLLAYALLAAQDAGGAAPGTVAGVAAVHLRPGKLRWRGAAASAEVLPALVRLKGVIPPWTELLQHWQLVIDGLVDEFVAGRAEVRPLPDACRNCHLPALCRIDPARQPETERDDEQAEAVSDDA